MDGRAAHRQPPQLMKEQLVNRTYRTRHANSVPSWGPAPGWDQPLPGWTPLVDHGPLPLRAAGSMARWWWPTLALASFGAVVGFMVGHDHPDPGLSQQALLVIALAAPVVVLLTLHRSTGPGALARAAAEYAVVALLAALLTLRRRQPAAGHPHRQGRVQARRHGQSRGQPGPSLGAPGRRRSDPGRDQGHPGRHRRGRLAGRPLAPSRRQDRPPQPSLLNHHPKAKRSPLPHPCLDLDQEVHMSLRFADLNPLGRAIIIVVAALTFGVAAISFATSYGALYAYARDTGLYSERLTRLWPLLLDGAFIVAQLAAILAGILRGSRGWPILTMLLTGALTVWFNLQHAGADPGRRLAAALPPVLMMLAFEIDIQIVRWVMTALGKPLGPIAPPPPDGMLPGAVWRSDGLDWNVPPHEPPRRVAAGRLRALTRQATTFRKTRRTGKPDCGAGRVLTRSG